MIHLVTSGREPLRAEQPPVTGRAELFMGLGDSLQLLNGWSGFSSSLRSKSASGMKRLLEGIFFNVGSVSEQSLKMMEAKSGARGQR